MPVNSLWFSGTGALPDSYVLPEPSQHPTMVRDLSASALAEDWSAWAHIWQELDATQIKSLLQTATNGKPVQLTLCGERSSQSWQSQPKAIWQNVKGLFGSQPLSVVLEKL
jgi:hypothetical protein